MKFKKGDLVRANTSAPFRLIGVVKVVGYDKDDDEVVIVERISKKTGNKWYQKIHEDFLELAERRGDK